jgi:hypothetical protein
VLRIVSTEVTAVGASITGGPQLPAQGSTTGAVLTDRLGSGDRAFFDFGVAVNTGDNVILVLTVLA